MARLVAVDYDPFASQSAQPRLTPVDYDPFAPTLNARASGSAGAVNKKAEAIWGGSFDDWKKRKEADDADRARLIAESEAGNVGSRRAQDFQRKVSALNKEGDLTGDYSADSLRAGRALESGMEQGREQIGAGLQFAGETPLALADFFGRIRPKGETEQDRANPVTEAGRDIRSAAIARQQEIAPLMIDRPDSLVGIQGAKYIAQLALQSAPTTGTGLAAAVINPAAGLSLMGAGAGSAKFADARAEDKGYWLSAEAGAAAAAAEVVPEMLPLGFLSGRLLKHLPGTAMKRMASSPAGRGALLSLSEGASEGVTELSNIAYEIAREGKTYTDEQIANRLIDATAVGTVIGGGMAAVAEATGQSARAYDQSKIADLELENSLRAAIKPRATTARILGPTATPDAAAGAQIADDAFRSAGVGTVAAADIAEQDALARDLDAAQRDQLGSEAEIDRLLTGNTPRERTDLYRASIPGAIPQGVQVTSNQDAFAAPGTIGGRDAPAPIQVTTLADRSVFVPGDPAAIRQKLADAGSQWQGMAREIDGVQGVRFGRNAWPEVQGVVGGVRESIAVPGEGDARAAPGGPVFQNRDGNPTDAGERAGLLRANAAPGYSGVGGDASGRVGQSNVLDGGGVVGRLGEFAANVRRNATEPTQAAVAVDGRNLAGNEQRSIDRAPELPQPAVGTQGVPLRSEQGATDTGRVLEDAGRVSAEPSAPSPPALRDLTDDAATPADFNALEKSLSEERIAYEDETETEFLNKRKQARDPLKDAVHTAVVASTLDPDSARSVLDVALSNGRLDLAEYAVARAERAVAGMDVTPGVPQSSPKYAGIKANLENRKREATAVLDGLKADLANAKASRPALSSPQQTAESAGDRSAGGVSGEGRSLGRDAGPVADSRRMGVEAGSGAEPVRAGTDEVGGERGTEPASKVRVRDDGAQTGASVDTARTTISRTLGPKFLARLDNQKWFQIVDSVADLPPDVRKSITGEGVAGFVLPDGRVFIVAEGAAANPVGVTLHELGVHYGMTGILGEDFAPTLAKFKRLRAKDDRVGRAYERATEAADKDKNGELTEAAKATLDEEALAYFVEENWDSPDTRGIVAKVIDAIKRLLNRLGMPLSMVNASPELLRNVAIGAARKAADGRISVGKDGKLRYHRAFHGTPHDFDKFRWDDSTAGTGEGAQAYGYGLYFAGNREVAEHYKNAYGEKSYFFRGKELPQGYFRQAAKLVADSGTGRALSVMNAKLDEASGRLADASGAQAKMLTALQEDLKDAIFWLESITQSDVEVRNSGKLYEVELAPDEADYLDWDAPLSEQSEKVREAVAKHAGNVALRDGMSLGGGARLSIVEDEDFGPKYFMQSGGSRFPLTKADVERMLGKVGEEKTGAAIYAEMSDALGGDREASRVLHAAGVPGIRYLDGSSRGGKTGWRVKFKNGQYSGKVFDTKAEADAAVERGEYNMVDRVEKIDDLSRNYVIFDDSQVEVKAKYSFAGRNAKTANIGTLEQAQAMIADGASAEDARKATGWFKGRDGKWRFEISDAKAKFIGLRDGGARKMHQYDDLQDVIDHPALFAAYPALRKVWVEIEIDPAIKDESGVLFAARPEDANTVAKAAQINVKAGNERDALSVLLHEIQHGVQSVEGFASGGSAANLAAEQKAAQDSIPELRAAVREAQQSYDDAVDMGYPAAEIAKRKAAMDQAKAELDDNVALTGAGDPFGNYLRLAGEVEARNTQTRQRMTDAERRATPPQSTQDVPDDRQVVRYSRRVQDGRIRKTVAELTNAADSMGSWRDWYDRHDQTLRDVFGDDAELFQKLLSATSQAASVPANVGLALKAYRQLFSGEPFTGYLPAVIKNLDRVAASEALRGQKISEYGSASEGNAGAIAVDRHIAMLFFGTKSPNRAQVESAKNRIRAIAERLGWQPREVQAALWAYNQTLLGTAPEDVKSYDKLIEKARARIDALRASIGRGEDRGAREVGGTAGRDGSAERDSAASREQARAEVGPKYSRRADGGPESLRVVTAGDVVDGRTVREGVPNQSSIASSLDDYTIIKGIREVPMDAFDKEYIDGIAEGRIDKRTQDLADAISASKEITPLIVAYDADGAYIIEGGHRLDALIKIGAKSLPAMVVIDESNPPKQGPTDARIAYSRKTPAEARAESAQKQADLGAQLVVSPGQSFVYTDQFTDDWRGQTLKMRERIQDKLLSVRNVQQDIEKIRGAIQDAMNVYRRENLMHGRVGDQRDKLQDTHVKPLIEAMAEAKVSPALLEDYLEARHAKERNEKIAAIKGGMPDGASGMTTAQAEDFLQGRAAGHRSGVTLDPAMTRQVSRLGRKVYAITAETRRRLLDSGQITQEAFDALESAYAAYVPLRGKDGTEGGKGRGTGKGIDVRGKPVLRAAGRGEGNRAQNILAEVIADAERSIINAEKLRVGRTLARLVLENPNPDVWAIEPVKTELKVSEGTPEEIYEAVKNLDQEEGTIIVKVKGKPYRIVIEDQRMADALKNMAVETVPEVIQYVAGLNRYFSAVLTRYNPSFVGVNMTRDLLFGITGIWAEHGTAAAAKAAASYFPAMRAAWRDIQGKPPVNAMGRYAREFAEAGGKTYFGKLENVSDMSQRIGEEFKTFRQMAMPKFLGGEMSPVRALAKVARDSKMVQAIEAVNDTVENTLRLSVYAALREAGASIEQAAEYAKNISVNFNRRGSATSWLNALYLFFNAATQGAHRTLTLLKNPKVQGVLGGLAALQATSAMFLMGLDDEDGEPLWDSISSWDKQRNLILAIPIKREKGWGATVIKIPMPYGFNLFPYMGGRSVELARDLQEKPVSRAIADYTTDAVVGVAQAMSPIPFDDGWKAALPHWVRIFTVLSENKDDLGIPIRAGDQYDSFDKPRSASGRDDTPLPFKIAATALNRLGGGDDYTPPYAKFALDWAPEDLAYLFKTFAGGLGSNVVKTGTLTEKLIAGVPVNFKDVPALSSFVSNVDQRQATSTRYYDHKDDIEREVARQRDLAKEAGEVGDNPMGIKIARNKSGAKVKRGEGYELEGKPGSLFDTYKQAEKDISRIRDEMRAAFNDQSISYTERIRKIDELKAEREEVQRELNAAWREQRKKRTQ